MPFNLKWFRNPMSLTGVVLATVSAGAFLVVFLADLFGLHTNPYIGIVFFIVLPGVFLLGLALIPLGGWLARRSARSTGEPPWPRFDPNDPAQRRVAAMVFVLTLVNIVIVSLATYRGIEYMDSVQFCGQACHTVMKPEFTAYQDGAHSRVTCVRCHIGSGASWFAKSKISGARQILAVTFHTYSTADPVAGREPAPGPGHVRAVPLAREVSRRQDPPRLRVRRGRKEHRIGDDAAGARRRRQRAARDCARHSLAHERGERGRVHRHRRQTPGHSVGPCEGSVRQRPRVHRGRGEAGGSGEGRTAPDGLHGLPQPAGAPDGGDAGARGQRADGERRDPEGLAVCPARGGEGAQGGVSDAAGGRAGDRGRTA